MHHVCFCCLCRSLADDLKHDVYVRLLVYLNKKWCNMRLLVYRGLLQ